MNRGPGRLLLAVYAVFALSATARATYQLAFHLADAPLAYLLSAFAGVVYIVAAVALASGGPTGWAVAFVAVTVEMVGVAVVGTWSLIDGDAFPDQTVWSGLGRGYGYVPLVLPMVGLAWLRRHRER